MNAHVLAPGIVFIGVLIAMCLSGGCRQEGTFARRGGPGESAHEGTLAMNLAFNSDESLLAAVNRIDGKEAEDTNNFVLMTFDVGRPEEEPHIKGYCSSSVAAWNSEGDGLYVLQALNSRVAFGELTLAGRVHKRSRSFPNDARASGSMFSYDAEAGVLACLQRSREGQCLVLWWPKSDELEQVLLPNGFIADLSMPPYVCGSGNVVVVVSSDKQDFAALDLGEMSWRYASIQPYEPKWQWHSWKPRDQRKDDWQMSGGPEKDLFFVDPQGYHLWAVVSEMPLGARLTPEGPVATASNPLVVLDVTSQEATSILDSPVVVLGHRLSLDGPSVFGYLFAGVASSEDSTTRVVLYNASERALRPRVDCVAYVLDSSDPQFPHFEERILYKNGEVVASGGIAVSRSGQLLALCRAGSDGELFLTVLKLPEGQEIAGWPMAASCR